MLHSFHNVGESFSVSLEQIKAPLKIDAVRFRLGLILIIYGIAKFIVADNVAIHANAVFVEGETFGKY